MNINKPSYLSFKGADKDNLNEYAQFHDIGASMLALTDKRLCNIDTPVEADKFIKLPKGIINTNTDANAGFHDESHFLQQIVKKIIATHKDLLGQTNLPLNLRKLVCFVPSIVCANPKTLEPNYAPFITNAKKITREGQLAKLEYVDYNRVTAELNKQTEIPVSKDLSNNVFFLNDLLGAGIKVAEDIAKKPELIFTNEEFKLIESINKGSNTQAKKNIKNPLEGFKAMVVMNGGGCGVSIVEFLNKEVIIKSPEGCHDIAIKMPEKGATSINIKNEITRPPKAGAAVGSLLTNFCENIGIDKVKYKNEINNFVAAGEARLVTEEAVKLDKKSDSHKIELLEQTGFFNIKEEGNKKEFRLKEEYAGSKNERFRTARTKTIEQYAYIMGELAFTSLNRGENALIVAGPLAFGINDVIKNNPQDFNGRDSLSGLIEDKMIDFSKNIVHDEESTKEMKDCRRYRIICDKEKFDINDNTEGAKSLLNPDTEIIRGIWSGNTVKLNLDAIKKVP